MYHHAESGEARPDHDDVETELRAIFGREADEPLPDLSVFPPEIVEFESPPGTYYDAFPLLVMTEQALGALALALPGSVVEVRRFRPSIVVDAEQTPGHPEFAWVGRRVEVRGGAGRVQVLAEHRVIAVHPRRTPERIVIDPAILVGKPVIRGTRLAVEFLLDLLAEGWTHEQVLQNYPQLAEDDIHAALHYAAEALKRERVFPLAV